MPSSKQLLAMWPQCDVAESANFSLTLSLSFYLACTLKTRIIDALLLCHSLTDAIMSAMMNFNLRNGNLRKKTDAIKVSFGVGFVVRDFGVLGGLKLRTTSTR